MKPTKKSYELLQQLNEIMKTPVLRKSKYHINTGRFRHHNNCGSTHLLMAASEENKLPPSFSGFKSKKISSWIKLWCGLRNRQWWTVVKKTLASVFHPWLFEAFSWFQNGSILLVNASCKRRALIIEDEFKILTFADYCKINRDIFNRLVWNQPLHFPSSSLNDFESVGFEKVRIWQR